MKYRYMLFILITLILNGTSGIRSASALKFSKKSSVIPLLDTKLTVLKLLQEYVSPKRINPSAMFYSAMKTVSVKFPEIMASKKGRKIIIRVGNKIHTENAYIASPWNMIAAFTGTFDFFRKNLPSDIKINQVEYAAIAGMLSTLDPHTAFMPPDLYSNMRIHTKGQFGGLGIVVSVCSGVLSVVKTLPGTPADRSGLKPGDKIIEIDSQPTSNLSLTEAVSRMRGEPGEAINLKIRRKSWKRDKKITIVREVISFDSVSHKILKTAYGKVGYIKIRAFQMPTAMQVKKAVLDIKKAGAKGIILDLRGNGGGLLKAAIDIVNYFVDSGVIVSQVTENSRDRFDYRADMNSTIFKKPLIILVDEGSASASEIVTGSLKYHNRAIVVGRRTFGKGTVQNVIPFADGGALKVTVAQYLTYGDTSIQGYGVLPDIEIHQVRIDPEQKGRPVVFYTNGYETTHESSLKSVLSAARKPRRNKAFYTIYALAAKPKTAPFRCRYCGMDDDDFKGYSGYSEEYEYDPYIDISKKILVRLAGRKISRLGAVKKISTVVSRFSKSAEKQIALKLKKLLKVDWSKHKNTNLKLKVSLKTVSTVKAGSWAKVFVKVKNVGKTTAYQLRGVIESSNPRLNYQEIIIGKLKPSATFKYTVRIKIPKGVSSRTDYIKLNLYAAQKDLHVTSENVLHIKGSEVPRLFVVRKFRDSSGDGVLSKNEIGYFDVEIKNTGKHATGEAHLILKNLTGEGLEMYITKYDISNFKPGKTKKFTFKVKALNHRINDWKFKLQIKDCNFGNNMDFPWSIKAVAPKAVKKWKKPHYVKISRNTYVYDVPWIKERTKIGFLKRGSVVKAKALINAHYALVDGGFVSSVIASDLKTSSKTSKIFKYWSYTPPRIEFKNNKHLLSNGNIYEFVVKISDNERLKDVSVIVDNTSDIGVPGDKVFYKAYSKGEKSDVLRLKIKLKKGVNIIRVTVRDSDKTVFGRNTVVLKP